MTTFIVPVRNDEVRLRQCLQSIKCCESGNSRVVVVDNGSVDASVAVAREFGATVLELPGVKVGGLRNRGAAAFPDDVLAFVDADQEIRPGWLRTALESLARPEVAAVGGPYSPPATATWVQRIYDAFRQHAPGVREVRWLAGGNLLVKSRAFAEVGGFDETLDACEDVDLCQRLRRAGYHLMSDSRLRCVHHGDPATLKALFLGELWRGRDNLRVSLSGGPLSWEDLPSIVTPIVGLACLASAVTGAILSAPQVSLAAILIFLGLAAGRASRLFGRLASRTALDLPRALAVAATYDAARALALVARFPHRRARQATAVATTAR